MWLSIITLKILWKLAVFSYSDVDIDIDGSLKVTAMSGWLLSLHLVSKLDNACKFRSYQTGLCIPWCLEHLCIWLQFVVSPFKLCLIWFRSWLPFTISKVRNPSDLFQLSAKESKCTLSFFVYWPITMNPRILNSCHRSFDISWPLYKNRNLPSIHTDGNLNMNVYVLD